MVRGITKFQEYFQSYTDNYVIIGGTACDIILRLDTMLQPSSNFQLPLKIKAHLQQFTTNLTENMPEKAFLKEMGVGNVEVSKVIAQITKSFNLTINE
jgi:hypothetical protein